jgi:hypothetical protein
LIGLQKAGHARLFFVLIKSMTPFFNRIFESRLLFALTLLLVIYGLFFVPDDNAATRTWTEIWNLGHIGAFFILWLFAFNIFPRLRQLSTVQLILLVCISTVVLGELIEYVQGLIGRDDELQDVWDSGVGAFFVVTFFSTQIQKLSVLQRYLWRLLALIVLVAVPWSIWSALADEFFIQRQFPVLCDFSTPFEMSRWHANTATMHLQKGQGPAQRYLAIEFRPAIYSTISLQYFFRDWRGYKHIVLDVTNPDTADLKVILRMHDRLHKQHHYALNDRFNRALDIKPGRQHIVIALADVEYAPVSRRMDLQHMEDLSIFTMQSKSIHYLYIHKIYLE